MKLFLSPALCLLFVLISLSSVAQQERRFRTAGALIGYGTEFSDNTDYKVLFLAGDYSQSWKRQPRKRDFVGWYAQPQFNLVHNRTTPGQGTDIEFGLNLGIRNYVRIGEAFYFYQMLGSGPHYISAHLQRQARGFIFSDNLALGSLIRLGGNGFLNLQAGVRHISNANIQIPNRGVNSYVGMIGYSKVFR